MVRITSSGARSKAVRAVAVTATARDATGWLESATSVTPGSGSDSTADRNDVDQASTVETSTEWIKVAFVPAGGSARARTK